MSAHSPAGLDALSRIRDHDPVKQLIKSKLSKNHLFRDFSANEITQLCNHLIGYKGNKGDAIFVEGQQAGYLCIIIDGSLDVIKDTGTGKSRKITDVPVGHMVGEMSLIDGEPHSATAIAAEPVLLAALTRQSLADLVYENPELGAKFYREMAILISRRLRNTDAELVNYLG
jgi:CRP/FNR family cyclic AMP-dependent transcriptional regulator